MNLIKTSVYTSISTAVTFISGFIVTKVVAIKIGPEGMAYFGQFQNTVAIFAMFSTCAITMGVVKYLATYTQDKLKQQEVITTSLSIIIISSIVVSIIILSCSLYLSKAIFHTSDFYVVYILFGLFITVISLNTFFNAVYNGLKQIRYLTIVNIIGSFVGIILTVTFANFLGVKGVLIASNFTAIIVFCVNLYLIKKLNGVGVVPKFQKFNKQIVKLLFGFTLMGFITGFATPTAQLVIRDKIIANLSLIDAGCWQAVTKISDYYLAFVTTVLGVYYLPKLSEINNKTDLQKEILNGYKIILPVVAFMALAIFLFKVWVVKILFTEAFLPMLPLFKYQLLGDFLKIGSWLLGYIMISKALIKMFIITEVLFSCLLILLSFWFIDTFGIVGATYAFCINYALYWLLMWILMKKYLI